MNPLTVTGQKRKPVHTELNEVMAFARIEHDANCNSATLGVSQRVNDDGIGEGVGGEVDRLFRGADQLDVYRVKPLFRREVDFLRSGLSGAEHGEYAGESKSADHCPSNPNPSAAPPISGGRFITTMASAFKVRHKTLGYNLRHDLVAVVDALAALKALGIGERIGDIAQSAAQWDHVSFVEERSHPFLSDGPLEFGEGFVVARKQVVPDNGRAGGIDHLERPLGFVLKPDDRDLYSDPVLLHDP